MKEQLDYLRAITIQSKERERVFLPPENASSNDKPRQVNRNFTVQLGSFKYEKEADSLIKILKKKGYPAYKSLIFLTGKEKRYRVRVGKYQGRDTAQKISKKINNEFEWKSFVTYD